MQGRSRTTIGTLAGFVVGVVLVASLPVGASNGDTLLIGEKNTAVTVTRLNTRGGLRIDNYKAGNPALLLNVADPSSAPLQVNATGLVDNLNADLLDGMDATDFHTGRTEFFLAMEEGDTETLISHGPLPVEISCEADGDTAHQNSLYVDAAVPYYAFGAARSSGRNNEATWQNWSTNTNTDRFFWAPSTGHAVWLYVGIADEDTAGADCILVGRAETIG